MRLGYLNCSPEQQKVNREKWAAALRSGKYKQGVGKLKVNLDGVIEHCCLGVACELFLEDNIEQYLGDKNKTYADLIKSKVQAKLDDGAYLPIWVQKWLGFRTDCGFTVSDESLTYLNDSGKSFEEIADIIDDAENNGLIE